MPTVKTVEERSPAAASNNVSGGVELQFLAGLGKTRASAYLTCDSTLRVLQ